MRVTTDALADYNFDDIADLAERDKCKRYFNLVATGRPFFWQDQKYIAFGFNNVSISRCYDCNRPTIWVGDGVVWPEVGEAEPPSPDLPEEMRIDYEEASAILNASSRGAAALLRLTIQKLCQHLGGKGQKLDDDIAMLVKQGLDKRVQQSLDVVRVIGNNAVHPGQIDLRDDRDTAEKLFGLVNLIVEVMISQPKHVAEMYESLPEGARKAIEKRDAS